jgi:hypothetical protein
MAVTMTVIGITRLIRAINQEAANATGAPLSEGGLFAGDLAVDASWRRPLLSVAPGHETHRRGYRGGAGLIHPIRLERPAPCHRTALPPPRLVYK